MNNIEKYDLVVIGGGVLGSFHAYHAINKGLKVALIEKNRILQGATVRNFGQVVPSGMNTKWQTFGRESLKIYKEIQSKFDISVRQEGSVYIASNEEEVKLLHELKKINQANNFTSELWTKEKTINNYAGINEAYVKESLFFPDEVLVEPRIMISKLHAYLQTKGLALFSGKTVVRNESAGECVKVFTADGMVVTAEKVIICNGSDFENLYPELFSESELIVSKLQMMATKPQPLNYKMKGAILTGLSIRRYEAFSECPSFKKIKEKESSESLEKKWGVHILFKQAVDGSVIIGDSHEYASVKEKESLGFDLNMNIDQFIIEEAKKIFYLPNYAIQHRWYGMYSQCKESDIYLKTIDKNIHIVTGIGGKGMTGSAGFSKENINSIFNF
ncbi:MAG: TIGR03364 family FAD-dependent oxidoreductase [Galbibacter orientalis]|uniref:TIGR03364 family FAD-dependent oxidoreductase n=1 Tax=Galbibacter orientalis TaxID=453852 RepID=UPI003001C01D